MVSATPYPLAGLDELTSQEAHPKLHHESMSNLELRGRLNKGTAPNNAKAMSRIRKDTVGKGNAQEDKSCTDDDFFVEIVQPNPRLRAHDITQGRNAIPNFTSSLAASYPSDAVENENRFEEKSTTPMAIQKIPNKSINESDLANSVERATLTAFMSIVRHVRNFEWVVRRSSRLLDETLDRTKIPFLISYRTYVKLVFIITITWQISVLTDQLAEVVRSLCEI